MSAVPSTPQEAISTSRTPLLSQNRNQHSSEVAFEPCGAEETEDLRRIADTLPLSVWLIAIVEFCERFAFFGIIGPMQNYIQNDRNDSLRPGGLGLGQGHATLVSQGFLLWCYITPLAGAAIADQYLGRVKTIVYSSMMYLCGLVLLVISSVLASHGIGLPLPGLLFALFWIGIGTGGIKSNVGSLIAEQYTGPKEAVRVLGTGEKVIVDRDLTLQRIFTMFFMYINVGSFAPLATTTIEQRYGFPAAFGLPAAVFVGGVVTILATQHRYVQSPPNSSVLSDSARVLWIAIRHKGDFNPARPRNQDGDNVAEALPWDNSFVDDVISALSGCKIFLLFPFYWAALSQLLNNFVSQAATMETHGIPNDIMGNVDTGTVLIILPMLDRVILPFLRRLGLPVRLLDRILVAFVFCGISMLYAAYLQHRIYLAPPCYNHPRASDCEGGRVPNQVSVFLQVPAYVLMALSEIFAGVAGPEYAYTKAPKSMKSLVMAIYLSTVSVGVLLAMAVSPLTKDPKLVWMYLTLGVGCLLAGVGVASVPL
ncbi:H+/oligopeptide symporter [Massariosphaeria phaeospora]|uniref:H+/oligopeptide symporter n=1 Tax=Massariosphaeria phaeospora TaxID=100035 RepID=A0A7C8M7J0_9PLEO|nr:H+/oligopeptide symporter [Massariosphaeria phaeospora]